MLGDVEDQAKASGSNPRGDGAQADDGGMLACVFSWCAQRRKAAMRIGLNRKDEIPREPDSEQAIHRCKLRTTRPLAPQNRQLMT